MQDLANNENVEHTQHIPEAPKVRMDVVKVETYKCVRCGWNWLPRIDHLPIACPRCKQRNWWKVPKATAKANKYRGPDGAFLYPQRGSHLT